MIYKCRNPECEFVFKAAIEPIAVLVPSRMPNPDVKIRVSGAAQSAA